MNTAQLVTRLSGLTAPQLARLEALTTYALTLQRGGLPERAINARLSGFVDKPSAIPASPAAARRAARRIVVSYMARGSERLQ